LTLTTFFRSRRVRIATHVDMGRRSMISADGSSALSWGSKCVTKIEQHRHLDIFRAIAHRNIIALGLAEPFISISYPIIKRITLVWRFFYLLSSCVYRLESTSVIVGVVTSCWGVWLRT
jgi:hypothetical protein